MGNYKPKGYINNSEFTKIVADYLNVSRGFVKNVIKVESAIIESLLEKGERVKFGELCIFELKDIQAKPEREFINPNTKKLQIIKATPAYKQPSAQFTIPITKRIRKITSQG